MPIKPHNAVLQCVHDIAEAKKHSAGAERRSQEGLDGGAFAGRLVTDQHVQEAIAWLQGKYGSAGSVQLLLALTVSGMMILAGLAPDAAPYV